MTEQGQSSGTVSGENVSADGSGVETGGQQAAAVATDSRTNERLVKAVGTYLVMGLGFVFTLFLVGQFAAGSGSGVGGGLLGGVGASAGYVLAVVLSPLIAVFVGTEIGKDGGGDAVIDAGIASAVGFVVMFFATLVVAASLGGGAGGGASGVVQVGPLVGLAVGVAITGAGSAAVARWEKSFADGVANPPLVKSILFGSVAYLVFTVGFAIAIVLAGALSSGAGGVGGLGGGLGGMGAGLLGFGFLFAPILAVLVGLFAGRDGLETPTEAAISGGVGSAVGALLMLIGLLIVFAITQPTGGAIPIPVGPIVGTIVGAGLIGTGAGWVGGR